MKGLTRLMSIAAASVLASCVAPAQPAEEPGAAEGVTGEAAASQVEATPAPAEAAPEPAPAADAKPVDQTPTEPADQPPTETAEEAPIAAGPDAEIQEAWTSAMKQVQSKDWEKVKPAMDEFLAKTTGNPDAADLRVQALHWVAVSYKEQGQGKKYLAALPAVVEEFSKLKDSKSASHDTLHAASGARFALAEADLPELEKSKLNPDLPVDKLNEAFKRIEGTRAGLVGKYMEVIAMGLPEWSVAAIYRIGYCYETQAGILGGMGMPKAIKNLPAAVKPEAVKAYLATIGSETAPLLTEAKSYYVKAIDLAKSSGMESEWTSKAQGALKNLEAATAIAAGSVPGS